jgi:dipeptidase E
MKYLLTDSGIRNPSINKALVELLGKPIAECNALCIPTAGYGHPQISPTSAWSFVSGNDESPMTDLGWKSVGVLELTALPSIDKERWHSWVREADVLLVNGGETTYLGYWMRESGLFDLMSSLGNKVYVGLSAGSLVMCPTIAPRFVHWKSSTGGDEMLGVVDFVMFPHVDYEMMPDFSMAHAEKWAADQSVPAYVTDVQTAIKVVDGNVEVISEGNWKLFTP